MHVSCRDEREQDADQRKVSSSSAGTCVSKPHHADLRRFALFPQRGQVGDQVRRMDRRGSARSYRSVGVRRRADVARALARRPACQLPRAGLPIALREAACRQGRVPGSCTRRLRGSARRQQRLRRSAPPLRASKGEKRLKRELTGCRPSRRNQTYPQSVDARQHPGGHRATSIPHAPLSASDEAVTGRLVSIKRTRPLPILEGKRRAELRMKTSSEVT